MGEPREHMQGRRAVGLKVIMINGFDERLKADSHIACRAHAVPLPCRAAKGLECLSHLIYTVRPCCGLENNGMVGAWAWHCKCESDTAALCKSNGKDTL